MYECTDPSWEDIIKCVEELEEEEFFGDKTFDDEDLESVGYVDLQFN